MYTLYTIPGSCSTGIAVLMEKLGVEYTSVKHESIQNYAEIVPTKQVPALQKEDGSVLTEGMAIALYLMEKYGEDALPSDIDTRAEFYQWLNFDYATLHPAYSKLFTTAFKVEIDEETKADLLQQLADKVSDLWAILDQRLTNQKFILGDEPCHVDYMAAIYSSWNNYFPDSKITLGENVKRFVADVYALPEFQAGYSAEQVEFKAAA